MDYNINKNSPIPYYYQIQLQLIDAIEKGQWKPNEFIPSERELSNKFEVSRITTKRAINNLRAEGYLKIIKGKGSIISQPKIEEHFFYNPITTFREFKKKGYKVENKICKFEIILPEDIIRENLNLLPEDQIYYIERLRFLNDEPYHYTKSYLPTKLYNDLKPDDLIDNAIFDLLTEKYNQKIIKLEKIFESSKTSFEDAKLFSTSVNFPILFFTNKTFNELNNPIEFSYNKIRGDLSKFKIIININKNQNNN